jgi:flagella basal body P-ring formation protein FlgA
MRLFLLAASAASVFLPSLCHAAMLRPFTEITPDRNLGRAPAPGTRILVGAAQLAAIARDFNVDWRPATGTEQAVLERRGETLPRSAIADALRHALEAAGAPPGSDISMPDAQPITIPTGSKPVPEIVQCSYDPAGGRFTALVSVSLPEMPPAQMRVSGAVMVLTSAAVPTHRLTRGTVINSSDIQMMHVRVNTLHGNAAIQPDQAEGMVLKHDVASGQPLTPLDVARPDLVQRGSLVHMTLNTDGIALVAEGVAKEPGAQGDTIHVENPTSRVIVEAEVIGPDAVRVAPLHAAITLAAAQ